MKTKTLAVLGLLIIGYPGGADAGCVGYAGPGGPCSYGPGGGLSTGPGGGLSTGPGGGRSYGPGFRDPWNRPPEDRPGVNR